MTSWQERVALALDGDNNSNNTSEALWVTLPDGSDVFADYNNAGDLHVVVLSDNGFVIGESWISDHNGDTVSAPHWALDIVATEFRRL